MTVTELVSLDDVLDHLNIPSNDSSQDVELQGFIDAASAFIQRVTGPIVPRLFTEVHSGTGGPAIVLFNPPVLTIDSVVEWWGPVAYPLAQAEMGTVASQYSFSLDSARAGILTRRYTGGYAGGWARGLNNIVVTYTAGRGVVDADIRMAVLQDIAAIWQPSQLGPGNSMFPNALNDGGKLNPIGMFPRVQAMLTGDAMRAPTIA